MMIEDRDDASACLPVRPSGPPLTRPGGRRVDDGKLGGSAPVAQLDRASVYGTEGQRFESSRARTKKASKSPRSASSMLVV